jgi:membrane-associated protease RseP (regulator of RpoE activity)
MQDQITTQWTQELAGTAALRAAVADVMRVEDVTNGVPAETVALMTRRADTAAREAEAVRLRGQLTVSSDQAYQRVSERFRRLGYTALLRKGDGGGPGAAFFAVPGELRQARQRIVMSAVLFALTVLSCLFVGAQYVEGLTATNWNLLDGLPYTAGLLGILVAHEFGHYLVARRVGTPVSLPYFLPMPLGLGTFGAFINMTAPPRNRRQLLGIAAAGPLAGLVVAIPVLWIGLSLSSVQPLPVEGGYQIEGNSLLYAGMKFLVFGRLLPSAGEDVFIHQLAFAGWVGLLVTGLNLIPAGQLDGGHILYALVGERGAKIVFWVVLAVMATLSLLYSGWLLWVFLIFLLGRLRVMPLDDVTDLTTPQRALAASMIVIFVLVFTPRPFTFVPPM